MNSVTVRTVTWRAISLIARSPNSKYFLLVNPPGAVWPGFIGTIHPPIYAGFYAFALPPKKETTDG